MSAVDRSFVDTNIWLYAFVAGQDAAKPAAAASLLQRISIVASVQVINEVCVNLIQKANFTETDVRDLIKSFYVKCLVAPLDQQVLLTASDLRRRYSISFWDSLIVSTALRSQARTLYSEDLQHGMTIDGVLSVVNPFVIK